MKLKKIMAALMVSATIIQGFSISAYGVQTASSAKISSITWQDPENAVLIWDSEPNFSYNIYRSDTKDGSYTMIGSSSSGSYRDNTAYYPNVYYYKIQPVSSNGTTGTMSDAVMSGTNPQKLSKVTVLMYHNFISDEDIKNGVVFEEYSLKPADFEADLQYFRNNGYTTITSADLINYINGQKPLPAKAIIISIDDGTLGVYENAWPLLKRYRAKADFNVIGENIDSAWQTIYDGGTRDGESAPYCQWNEIVKMCESGEINICSHTYGLHHYNRDGRKGTALMEGEDINSFINMIKEDYSLAVSCINGWTNIMPKTMAYPYSRRSSESDKAILENTGYEILMAGDGARPTSSNYFVDGASPDGYWRLINRPCRMEGHPASEYINNADAKDSQNGVNTVENTLLLTNEECTEIAKFYSPFEDVSGEAWYSGAVYYGYVNSLFPGATLTNFFPDSVVSRSAAAATLYQIAGEPNVADAKTFDDVQLNNPSINAVSWATDNNIIPPDESNLFNPDEPITRAELALALYQYSTLKGIDIKPVSAYKAFSDESSISSNALQAVRWAVERGIFSGDDNGKFLPNGELTKAQLAVILQNFIQKTAE